MDRVSPAGPDLSGRDAVGKSARDDGGTVVARAADAGALSQAGVARAHARRRAWPTRRATRAWPLQVNALGSMITPFFTATRVRDFQSAVTADTDGVRRVLPRDARARRLPSAVAVRSVVHLRRAHGPGHRSNRREPRARRCARSTSAGQIGATDEKPRPHDAESLRLEAPASSLASGAPAASGLIAHALSGSSSRMRSTVPGGELDVLAFGRRDDAAAADQDAGTAPFTPPRMPPMMPPTAAPAPIFPASSL